MPSSRVAPRIRFSFERPSGQDVVSFDKVSFTYPEGETIIDGLETRIDRGDKIAIVGRNGIGKTTMMRLLQEELEPTKGTISWGGTTRRSYFPQENSHLFTEDLTILDWISQFTDSQDINEMRAMLGRMLFSGEDVKKSVKVLSGGERVRCLLSMVMLQTPNVLLLDEPTGHLDLESIEALQESLQEYPGTLVVVSHDRQFVDSVASRVWVMSDSGIEDWRGSYSDYRAATGLD